MDRVVYPSRVVCKHSVLTHRVNTDDENRRPEGETGSIPWDLETVTRGREGERDRNSRQRSSETTPSLVGHEDDTLRLDPVRLGEED